MLRKLGDMSVLVMTIKVTILKEIPDYKNNKYYKNRNFLKRTIEKNKLLTKLYVKLYK